MSRVVLLGLFAFIQSAAPAVNAQESTPPLPGGGDTTATSPPAPGDPMPIGVAGTEYEQGEVPARASAAPEAGAAAVAGDDEEGPGRATAEPSIQPAPETRSSPEPDVIEARPDPIPPPKKPPEEDPPAPSPPESHDPSCARAKAEQATTTTTPCDHTHPSGLGITFGEHFRMSFDGYLRATYSTFTPDRLFGIKMPKSESSRQNPYVGRNDGFGIADARLNLRAVYKDLTVRLGFDGALVSYEDPDDLLGVFSMGLKDAYFKYDFHRAAVLSVGRFKPPFDIESLIATEDQYFVNRALETRGVLKYEGYSGDMDGFAQGRQLGVMVGSGDFLDMSMFTAGYAVALTNGNTDIPFNDNDLPALYARLHGGLKFGIDEPEGGGLVLDEEGPATYESLQEGVFAGVSFMLNDLTFGAPPNRQHDFVWGFAADVTVRYSVLFFQGQFIYVATEHPTFTAAASESAMGGHAQIAIEIPIIGLAPAYRLAVYDPRIPSVADLASPDDDLVVQHSIGLRWTAPTYPIVVVADYTHSDEQAARAIPNDRVEIAVQVTFE